MVSVLIVEDEPVLALEMENALQKAGFAIAGIAGSCLKALAVLECRDCDLAVLDANLRGSCVEPVVAALQARGKPYLLISGYDRTHLASGLREAPFLPKPFGSDALVRALNNLRVQAKAQNLMHPSC
jgi:DNA-binding response OmpR family regulator